MWQWKVYIFCKSAYSRDALNRLIQVTTTDLAIPSSSFSWGPRYDLTFIYNEIWFFCDGKSTIGCVGHFIVSIQLSSNFKVFNTWKINNNILWYCRQPELEVLPLVVRLKYGRGQGSGTTRPCFSVHYLTDIYFTFWDQRSSLYNVDL